MTVALDALLVRSPDICGDRLRLAGTRITVGQLVILYKEGLSPEEIADQYPHLELAQIYTALSYYHANREELEASLAAEQKEAKELEAQYMGPQRRSA